MSVAGDHVFVAAREAGLAVLPLQCPASAAVADPAEAAPRGMALSLAGANPVGRWGTPFALVLRDDAPVRVVVYDALGRPVREVVDGYLTGGVHRLSWDGRDEAGRRVSRGVYFLRLSAPGGSAVERLVVAR